MTTRAIYLDNNATTRVDRRVVEAMLPYFREQFGNPSSMHAFGSKVGSGVAAARRQVQALLGAQHDHEIVFTSGGTESNNAALLSALETFPDRNEIVTSAVEHPAILAMCEHLHKTRGTKVHYIGVDKHGRLDLEAYRKALSNKVAIVSFMWANNETGTINPVAELAELAKERGALFHSDAVQAAGKIAIDLKSTAIDMLSVSGHKLHGPKGIGALYVRRGVRFKSLLRGGHQERGRRAGTENAPGIVGFGIAAQLAAESIAGDLARIAHLRDRLEAKILQSIGNCSATGDTANRLANTSNIAFEFIEGEAILLLLNREGIAASSGSACTSGSLEPSHVMRAMGVPYTAAHGAIRFSLSRETTDEDIDHVIAVMPGIITKLRNLSPFWSKDGEEAKNFQPTYA